MTIIGPGTFSIIGEAGSSHCQLRGDLTVNTKGDVTLSGDFCRRVALSRDGGSISGDQEIEGGQNGVAHTLELSAGKGIRLSGSRALGRVSVSLEKTARRQPELQAVEVDLCYTGAAFDLGLMPDSLKATDLSCVIPAGSIIEAITVDTVSPFKTLDGVIPLSIWFRVCGAVVATGGHYEKRGCLVAAQGGRVLSERMVTVSRTHLIADEAETPQIIVKGATNHRDSPGRLFAGRAVVSVFYRR